MLPFDRNFRFYLLLGSLVLVLGVVVILGLVYFRLQKLLVESPPSTTSQENKYLQQVAHKELKRLEAESATMAAQPKPVEEKCLWVPLEQEVKTGIYKWAPVLKPEGGVEPGFFDFHYSGRLDDFQEQTINDCPYYQLTLFRKGNFVLNIPKGMIAVGAFSRLDPAFLNLHKGRNFQIRIRFFSPKGDQDLSSLKFIEWEIEALKVN